MASTTGEIKAGANAIKTHWVAFLVAGLVLVGLAFWYEKKNPGAVIGKLAKLPLVGSAFQ